VITQADIERIYQPQKRGKIAFPCREKEDDGGQRPDWLGFDPKLERSSENNKSRNENR